MKGRVAETKGGGDRGIRTLDRALQPYNGLANRRLQPLGHISVMAAYARQTRHLQVGDCATHVLIVGCPCSICVAIPWRWPGRQQQAPRGVLRRIGFRARRNLRSGSRRVSRPLQAEWCHDACADPRRAGSTARERSAGGLDLPPVQPPCAANPPVRFVPAKLRGRTSGGGPDCGANAAAKKTSGNQYINQRLASLARSRLRVICATHLQKRRHWAVCRAVLCCLCRGVG